MVVVRVEVFALPVTRGIRWANWSAISAPDTNPTTPPVLANIATLKIRLRVRLRVVHAALATFGALYGFSSMPPS